VTRPILAGIIYLFSNNSEVALTPEGLRKLAVLHDGVAAPSETTEFKVHRLSARLNAELIDNVIQRYESGESARSLATEIGIAPSALLRLFRERNVTVQPRFVTPEQGQAMAKDYTAGMTVVQLEAKYRFSHNAVLRALRNAGVEMRPTGRRKNSV